MRLPDVKASYDFIDGTMDVDFDDGRDEYRIKPRSQKIRDLVRELGPDAAGEALADEFERLNTNRRRVLYAIMSTLHVNDYGVDFWLTEHYGRQHQEFTLDLGQPLTTPACIESG